jgi:MFS family permease
MMCNETRSDFISMPCYIRCVATQEENVTRQNNDAIADGRSSYAWYVVIVLMLSSALSFVDRQILSLLVAPIKHDLSLSDTRIGLLQGLAFAVFYAFLGFPLGRLGDRGNRKNLIAGSIFSWSVMTSLCGAARGFWSMFLPRIGVGIGEAGLSPAAVSLISDYFSAEELGTALSVFSMGVAIGSGLALIIGGSVIDGISRLKVMHLPLVGVLASWRVVFLVVGMPGLIFALWAYLLGEPARKNLLRTQEGNPVRIGIRETTAQLRSRWRSMMGLSVTMACQSIGSYAFFAWAPTFFQRVHGWTAGQAGMVLGVLTLVFACSGMFLGGRVCSRLQTKRIADAPLKLAIVSAIGAGALLSLAVTAAHAGSSLGLLAPALFCLGLPVGTSYAAVQLIFPNQMRAQVIALFLFCVNIGGLTLGPLLPALFEDYVFRSERMIGPSLALSILISSVGMLIAALVTCRPYRYHFELMHPAASHAAQATK